MPGYILDTNHISAHFAQTPGVLAKRNSLPAETLWFASPITIGEIEAAHRINQPSDWKAQQVRNAFIAFLNAQYIPLTLEITYATRFAYADIIEGLWKDCACPPRTRTEYHLAHEFGVDINDVWIVASALEHNLTLVTQDKMERISKAVGVRIECWL